MLAAYNIKPNRWVPSLFVSFKLINSNLITNKMKRLNLIVLGLLTLSLAILTEKLNLSDNSDKLLCTILWMGWLISAVAIYLFNTQNYVFKYESDAGFIIGFAFSAEKTKYITRFSIVLPFFVLMFTWEKIAHGNQHLNN